MRCGQNHIWEVTFDRRPSNSNPGGNKRRNSLKALLGCHTTRLYCIRWSKVFQTVMALMTAEMKATPYKVMGSHCDTHTHYSLQLHSVLNYCIEAVLVVHPLCMRVARSVKNESLWWVLSLCGENKSESSFFLLLLGTIALTFIWSCKQVMLCWAFLWIDNRESCSHTVFTVFIFSVSPDSQLQQ